MRVHDYVDPSRNKELSYSTGRCESHGGNDTVTRDLFSAVWVGLSKVMLCGMRQTRTE